MLDASLGTNKRLASPNKETRDRIDHIQKHVLNVMRQARQAEEEMDGSRLDDQQVGEEFPISCLGWFSPVHHTSIIPLRAWARPFFRDSWYRCHLCHFL